jgi:Na+/glutamate symporter
MEEVFGGALGGAGTGAGIGAMLAGPTGGMSVPIGAGIGLLAGGIGGLFKKKARDKQKQSLQQARSQLEGLARDQRAQRAQDLEKAMSFFAPAQSQYQRLYGG